MRRFQRVEDLDVAGKRVLVRVDLNVPMQDGRISDATRIQRLAPTLNGLAERGAKVIVLSHFGRPRGRQPSLSLRALAAPLSIALGGRAVAFADDCVGAVAEAAVARLRGGEVLLLENVRFHAGEEKNDPAFTACLAALGDLYVNDAFSAAHRAHASTCGLAQRLPAAAGKLMEAELDALAAALERPERPVAAIVGGAKVSTKIDLLANLVGKVNALIIGGGMANTFLAAHGVAIGKSLCERDRLAVVATIEARAKESGCAILLPVDAVIARKFEAGAPREVVPVSRVPDDAMILDVGPESVRLFSEHLAACRTLVWNGPVGAFELAGFAAGTMALARRAAELTATGTLRSVAGGGDTVAALAQAGVVERFSYVSTAGGAFLEWLEGKELPGVQALLRPA